MEDETKKIKILIVDDSDAMRALVKQYLRSIDAILVTGEAKHGDECLNKVRENNPDLVLIDISLSGESGIEIARKIKLINPNLRVYLYSAYEVEEYRKIDLDSPADGFIRKTNLKNELLEMIKKEVKRNYN